MGGTDKKLHMSPMIFAKGFKTKGVMHGVNVRKVHIMESGQYRASDATPSNTRTIDITYDSLNSGSIIVDSGTTDTYFTRNLNAPFRSAFKKIAGYDYDENGMSLTDEQVEMLPTILLQLEGIENADTDIPGLAGVIDPANPTDVLIAIPPSHYIEYDTQSKRYVGRFSMTESRGSVIGANTIRGHDVFFDIISGGRIGFAESDCDYLNLIELNVTEVIDDTLNPENNTDEVTEGDDYYDEKSNLENKDKDKNDLKTDRTEAKCGKLCKNGMIGFGLAFGVLAVFTIYQKIYNKHAAKYERAVHDNEHLNDLVLDTEIQMTEIA
jgi:hypothetical protein